MISLFDLKLANTTINQHPYKTEIADDWTPIDAAGGDCDSYATAKLQRLVQQGWPERSLRLACCFVEPSAAADKRDRYHAVLLADWDGQTWVLDNRYPLPMEYQMLPYEWHKFWSHDLNAWEYAENADRSYA